MEKTKELDWPIVDHVQGETKESVLEWKYCDNERGFKKPTLEVEEIVPLKTACTARAKRCSYVAQRNTHFQVKQSNFHICDCQMVRNHVSSY